MSEHKKDKLDLDVLKFDSAADAVYEKEAAKQTGKMGDKEEPKSVTHKSAIKPEDALSQAGSQDKLRESIARNVEFNKNLAAQKVKSVIERSESNGNFEVDLDKIEQVLKLKGMDSQQRSQAMEMIRDILTAS